MWTSPLVFFCGKAVHMLAVHMPVEMAGEWHAEKGRVVGQLGIEPRTISLKGCCSTD